MFEVLVAYVRTVLQTRIAYNGWLDHMPAWLRRIMGELGTTIAQFRDIEPEPVRLYLEAVMLDGDWANDWLTHMPGWLADIMTQVGQALAYFLGV